MPPFVALDRVSHRYGDEPAPVSALRDVSLTLERGEFVAVAGPSGSGKSTLLNIIGCLDRPTTGSVRFDGADCGTLDDRRLAAIRRRTIGFVFQTFNLIPVFTVVENVEYPLILGRVRRPVRRRLVAEVLESLALTHRAGQRPDLLSGGERQRVAVARAIVNRPTLVVADEPTASLDTVNATALIDLLRRLNRDLGVTFVFATHDSRLLSRADRVITLQDGRVTFDTEASGEAA